MEQTCGPGSGSRVLITNDGYTEFAVVGDRLVVDLLDSIVIVPRAGGDATTLSRTSSVIGGLAIARKKVFFIANGADKSAPLALMSVPLAGGQPQVVVDNVSMSASNLLSDGSAVYFQLYQTHVLEVDAKSGATIDLRFDNQLDSPELVGAYGGFVYVVGFDQAKGDVGVIERIPKQGGTAQRIYSSTSGYPDLLTVDASGLYWNETEPPTYGSGSIRHANLDGSSPTTLLPDIRALSLAPDGGELYFSEGDRIAKLGSDGKATPLVEGLDHPYALQLGGHDAVWIDRVKTDPGSRAIEAACVR